MFYISIFQIRILLICFTFPDKDLSLISRFLLLIHSFLKYVTFFNEDNCLIFHIHFYFHLMNCLVKASEFIFAIYEYTNYTREICRV